MVGFRFGYGKLDFLADLCLLAAEPCISLFILYCLEAV